MALAGSPDRDIVLIGGQIASGKTSIANQLCRSTGAHLIRVREALEQILGGSHWDRRRLQDEGYALDRRTNGQWLLHFIQEASDEGGKWVIDAARTRRQVEPVLEVEQRSRLIYLDASEATRRSRFALAQRSDPVKASLSFDDTMSHSTEREADALRAMAHLAVDTDDLSIDQIGQEVRSFLGWQVSESPS